MSVRHAAFKKDLVRLRMIGMPRPDPGLAVPITRACRGSLQTVTAPTRRTGGMRNLTACVRRHNREQGTRHTATW